MKIPVLLTFVILLAGSLWGLREAGHVARLKETRRNVLEQAAMLGLELDTAAASTRHHATPHRPERNQTDVRDLAARIATLLNDMKDLEKSGSSPDASIQSRIVELIDSMLSLSSDQLKALIGELKARTDMNDETKRGVIGFAIMMLSQKHPESALAIFTESSDIYHDPSSSIHFLTSALSQWAKDQPLAALEWIRNNAAKHPSVVTDEAKRAVIAGTARQDFGLALQLIGELKLMADDGSAIRQIAAAADTPENQTAFLAALRKQASIVSDRELASSLTREGMRSLVDQVTKTGFDKASSWLKTSDLSATELEPFISGLKWHSTKEDTGKWLDWLSDSKAEPKQANETTNHLVREWTRNDYKSAGEWLADSPTGSLKETATMAYLETVAPYDPETAARWAATLAADPQRTALKRIHDTLLKKDPNAAEDFARRHGIADP